MSRWLHNILCEVYFIRKTNKSTLYSFKDWESKESSNSQSLTTPYSPGGERFRFWDILAKRKKLRHQIAVEGSSIITLIPSRRSFIGTRNSSFFIMASFLFIIMSSSSSSIWRFHLYYRSAQIWTTCHQIRCQIQNFKAVAYLFHCQRFSRV